MAERSALIYGATGGIGAAVCRELCAQNIRCFLIGRSAEKLGQLRKELQLKKEDILCTPTITTTEQFESVRSILLNRSQRFNVAVHCAGYGVIKRAVDIDLHEWNVLLDTNLTSAFAFYQLAWAFRDTGPFDIVFFGSAATERPWPKNTLYGASKAGLEMFARCLQAEVRPQGGRVWLYRPGSVRTAFFDQLPPHVPRDKMIDPEILAKIVVRNLMTDTSVWVSELTIYSE